MWSDREIDASQMFTSPSRGSRARVLQSRSRNEKRNVAGASRLKQVIHRKNFPVTMSYNPAFIHDESPLSCAGDFHSHSRSDSGIQLIAYKPFREPKAQSRQVKLCPAFKKTSNNSPMIIDDDNLLELQVQKAALADEARLNEYQSWSVADGAGSGPCAAVECRNLRYHFGRGHKQKTILHDINVTVPEGSIYGLLGPSGCGKTTMLRCVVGRLKPKSGYVKAFGYAPNEKGSQIPGSAIGYMPQEIAVQKYFTIYETLTYYGKINRMKRDLIDARIEFLLNFLDLPEKDRIIEHLSGGQKRRVSLAAALVHSPPLLILDEPTVGVDPLLRQSIWRHLVFLAKTEKITVIITTHYIEEARQANVVGLMRHGRLLAEDSPQQLIARYGMKSLEDVFLKLCVSDSSRKAAQMASSLQPPYDNFKSTKTPNQLDLSQPALLDVNGLPVLQRQRQHRGFTTKKKQTDLFAFEPNDRQSPASDDLSDDQGNDVREFLVNKNRLRSMRPGTKYAPKKTSISAWTKTLLAIIWKNYIRLKRNPPLLLFEFILPSVQLILFCLCIGGQPFDIPLAVVNDETIPFASRLFLDAIDKDTIHQIPYNNLSAAIESVRHGETWGAIHIPDRYTQSLQDRLINPGEVSPETLANATIKIYPDLTNLHLALAMENTFRKAFVKFAKDTLSMFGYDPDAAEMPIQVEEPVYGTLKRDGFLEFMAPGVVISMTYVMAAGLTALVFILEKRDGALERSLVSGVTTTHVLLAHAAVQVVVMFMQISLVLAFKFLVFKIPSNGPFIWVVLLILFQGCTGMGFGLLISALCEEENTAVMMLVGTFYTNLMLAGIIWPLAAMPRWLRWFSYVQPQTLATETLRNILSRGWGLTEPGVYLGFLMTIGWLIVFLGAAGLLMRYSK